MATKDAQMNVYLAKIDEGVYGKDIKSAIHDGMERTFNKSYEWADDSLTKSNKAVADSSKAIELISEISDDVKEIKDLAANLEDEYEETAARISNIIAHNNDTEGNTELIDIRVTYNGYTSISAGDAVRLQARTLNGRISNLALNNPTSQIPVEKPASISYVPIWTNPDPNSAFNSTKISVPLESDTMEYLLEYKDTTSSGTVFDEIIPIPATTNETRRKKIFYTGGSVVGTSTAVRWFTVTSNSIEIQDSTYTTFNNPFSLSETDLTINDLTTSSNINNSYIIPLKIYAVKHLLDTTLEVSKDTELIDARTGLDGVIYDTVGDAIRNQITQYLAPGIIEALNADY